MASDTGRTIEAHKAKLVDIRERFLGHAILGTQDAVLQVGKSMRQEFDDIRSRLDGKNVQQVDDGVSITE